jgi:hypothetical protein
VEKEQLQKALPTPGTRQSIPASSSLIKGGSLVFTKYARAAVIFAFIQEFNCT